MAVLRETEETATGLGGLEVVQRPTRVVLRVWGFRRDDVALAESKARRMQGARFWEITEVIATSGGVSPIPSHDPVALNQGADYDWAWAVYLAGSDAG